MLVPALLVEFPLLTVLGLFLIFFLLVPNWVLYPILKHMRSRWVTEEDCPERYFETIKSANATLLVIVGFLVGFFQFSGHVAGIHQTTMVTLLFMSAFSGLVATIDQITPSIKPSGIAGMVKALPLTRHLTFVATYYQVVFLVLGFLEAYLSLVPPV